MGRFFLMQYVGEKIGPAQTGKKPALSNAPRNLQKYFFNKMVHIWSKGKIIQIMGSWVHPYKKTTKSNFNQWEVVSHPHAHLWRKGQNKTRNIISRIESSGFGQIFSTFMRTLETQRGTGYPIGVCLHFPSKILVKLWLVKFRKHVNFS